MSRRKTWPKGTWMKLTSKEILIANMEYRNFSTGRLAQYAKCSRSFIGHLRSGYKTSCSPELAERISEALGVPRISLFVENTSTVGGSRDSRQRRIA